MFGNCATDNFDHRIVCEVESSTDSVNKPLGWKTLIHQALWSFKEAIVIWDKVIFDHVRSGPHPMRSCTGWKEARPSLFAPVRTNQKGTPGLVDHGTPSPPDQWFMEHGIIPFQPGGIEMGGGGAWLVCIRMLMKGHLVKIWEMLFQAFFGECATDWAIFSFHNL